MSGLTNLECVMRHVFNLLACLAFCTTVPASTLTAAEIRVTRGSVPGEADILVIGPIEEGDDNRLYQIAEMTPRATVYLESPGGLVTTGISMAAEIAIRGYTTSVLDGAGCHSICAIMWVAGARRHMTPDASISVHAAYRMRNHADGLVETSESGVANAQIGAFLNQAGLSADAIRYFTFAGPSEDLLQVTPEIAQGLSIDVYIDMPNGTITPAQRPTPRRITRQVSEYSAMVGHCATLFGVDGSVWKVKAQTVLRQGHDIFGGKTFAPLLGEYVDTTKTDIAALGLARWCLSAEQNLRSDGLDTGITGPSYDCLKSSTPTEHGICAHRELWAIDRVMANLYTYLRDNSDAGRKAELVSTQKLWLARRDQCADAFGCLYERYASRLFDFGF